jgi:hypothetical protein
VDTSKSKTLENSMKKITLCAAMLIAVSITAQNNPPVQPPSPVEPEITQSPAPPQPTTPAANSEKASEEVQKKLQELGYRLTPEPQGATTVPMKVCAIPLQTIPVPASQGFAIRNAPANPSIDPKIVQAPPFATCSKAEPARVIVRERMPAPVPKEK